jgi:hypothetical protein
MEYEGNLQRESPQDERNKSGEKREKASVRDAASTNAVLTRPRI